MYNNPPMFMPPQEPKCCGCISLRLGSGIICLIWAAFSMYLAVLSFQNKNLFFSHLSQAPITVYGVVNLILSLVSVGGMIILIMNVRRYVHTFSHAVFVSVFLVLVDGFVNVILFITSESKFRTWCVSNSSRDIQKTINETLSEPNIITNSFDFADADYYNCHKLWQDELKFGIIFYVLMFAFYFYWSLCIYSFSVARSTYTTSADIRDSINHRDNTVPMMGVNIPPPAMIPGNPGMPGTGGFPNDRSVIVLNNHKPRSKSTVEPKKKDAFSFRNIKKSKSTVAPSSNSDQLHVPFIDQSRNNSQFTIGFRLDPDGNIIDIENAPSSVIDNKLKRKPINEDHKDGYY